MSYFESGQERAFKRIKMLLEEINDTDLREEPCPLLSEQLNELLVLTERLQTQLRGLRDSME